MSKRLIEFLSVLVAVLVVHSAQGHQTPLGAVNNNGDIGVRGSDGSLRQGPFPYFPFPLVPLGGVNNNANIGVRKSDGSLRQGNGLYGGEYKTKLQEFGQKAK
ncbi:uncharacterized protein LOC135134420 [Zophobas morio]|uniref:uncharacterized protein LOC135134420 n=1 Tax=Zophobas morio TaxID=2755281 RepID=UPI0030831DF5